MAQIVRPRYRENLTGLSVSTFPYTAGLLTSFVLPALTTYKAVSAGRNQIMFITKCFSNADIEERGLLDPWLNGLCTPGYGVKIVNSVVVPAYALDGYFVPMVYITVSKWKLGPQNLREAIEMAAKQRETIDQIPEEPTINYLANEDGA